MFISCVIRQHPESQGAGGQGPCAGPAPGFQPAVTVSTLGRLRLILLPREPRFGGLGTAGIPRRATAMPVGAIEPDEHPA